MAYCFARKWVLTAIDLFSDQDLRDHFPKISAQLSTRHLRFYWWPSKNVGDLVTKYLVERFLPGDFAPISEKEIRRIERSSWPLSLLYGWLGKKLPAKYIVSTGSVVRLCGRRALVFGSGIRSKEQSVMPANVRFVRGPFTRDRFCAAGASVAPVFGDPGLLMPRFYNPSPGKKFRLAIIPHFTEFGEVVERYRGDDTIVVVDMGNGDLEGCIDNIVASDATVSSSLHGLVFSHAYRVPTRHVMFSDKVFGDGTKFRDYYASLGLVPRTLDLRSSGHVSLQTLIDAADEVVDDFNDYRLFDEFFIDESGLKRSTLYPF
jgi:hypothetical protein